MAILSASLRPDRSIAASIQTIFFSIYPAKLDPELPGISAKATAIKIGIFKQNSRFQQFETHLSIPFLTIIEIADIAVEFMISDFCSERLHYRNGGNLERKSVV